MSKTKGKAKIKAKGKVVMLYGSPLSGKSTAAEKIMRYLSKTGVVAKVISSSKLRMKGKLHGSTTGFIDERNKRTRKVKDKAYQEMCINAEKCLLAGVVPILDATHHLYRRRKQVYATAARNGAQVYVVWTALDDEEGIKKLLMKRMRAGKLTALHTWGQYETMVRQTERLEDFELEKKRPRINIVKFDRKNNRTTFYNCRRTDLFARGIAAALTQPQVVNRHKK